MAIEVSVVTIKFEEEPKQSRRKKRRFFGNGEWYCVACGDTYPSEVLRSITIDPNHGCPNCGGKLSYEEV